MSERPEYFSDWRARTYPCPCGWSGSHEQLESEYFSELLEHSCPKCGAHLLLIQFPTGDDIKRAAAEGNAEAKEMLGKVAAREETATASRPS